MTEPVSLGDATRLVRRVRKAFATGIGDVRSNETVKGLLSIAEQWILDQAPIEKSHDLVT